jgi:hypothetical protein
MLDSLQGILQTRALSQRQERARVRSIEVSDEVFAALQAEAEPFVDTPETVLRRLLGMTRSDEGATSSSNGGASRATEPASGTRRGRRSAQGRRRKRGQVQNKRAPKGSLTPDSVYERPLLEVLDQRGGRVPTSDVLVELERRLQGHLKPIDYEPLSRGETRWKNRVQFVRLKLIQRGDISGESPRGVWEITEQGRERVRSGR